MNAALLLEHYAQIVDAPDAIARLRKFVLDLAVRGKLTDFPASASEVVPLGDLATFVMGQAPPGNASNATGDGTLFVKVGEFGPRYPRELAWTTQPLKMAQPGDVLICVVGATIGKLNLGIHCAIGRSVAAIRPSSRIDQQFLYYSLMPFTLGLREGARGTAQGVISRPDLISIQIWCPPATEQHRIVAKVDELMALCDQLEVARAEREAARDTFALSTLAKLNTPDPVTFAPDASFALANLAPLTTRPDQIKQLRQTILNLAVCGKLVEQDAADGGGLDYMAVLPNVDQVKGRGRKTIAISKVEPSEEYLDIPQHWTWARIHELGVTQTGTSPSSANSELFGDFIPFVKPGDLDGATISYDGPGLSEQGVGQSRLAPAATVMMVCIGATLGKVNITDRDVCFNQQINSVTPYVPETSPFLALALKASGFQQLAWSKAGTGTLPIISKGKWEILPIPVPPLAEQHRIVAKVDELMALCDQLEGSITTGEQSRSRLLEAVLHNALEPA